MTGAESMALAFLAAMQAWNNFGAGTPPEELYGLLGLGLYVTCISSIWIISILLAYWAYKDAKSRNMDSPALWAIIVFFLGLIGLIIYLIVRPDEPVQRQAELLPPPP